MIELQNARVNTAGAYVCTHGLYPFAIGIQPYNGRIPVVRLGGHREEHETGWECAAREVYEEANLRIKPLTPATTYISDGDHSETEPREMRWQRPTDQECIPQLVVAYQREGRTILSLMYLARADELPNPCSEVKGLLLLERKEVHWLCQEPVTLGEYLDKGGKAMLSDEFDRRLILEPFIQLRLLSRIWRLSQEPVDAKRTANRRP